METKVHYSQRPHPGAEGLYLSRTRYTDFEFPRHFHEYYTILLIEDGMNAGFTEDKHYKIGPGTILVINPGEVHAGRSCKKAPLQFSGLRIDAQLLQAMFADNQVSLRGDLVFKNQPIRDQWLSNQLTKLIHSSDGCSREATLCFFFELYARYNAQERSFQSERIDYPYLNKARAYICDHFQDHFSLRDLASACQVSEYHLLRQFKAHFGLTPFAYLRNYRIEKAKALLRQQNSLTWAAHAVGFYDQSHFIRHFKNFTGALPSDFLS